MTIRVAASPDPAAPAPAPGALSRRQFLQLSLEASGSLLVSLAFPSSAAALAADVKETRALGERSFVPNQWIRMHPNGEVTVLWEKSEMGQGVCTALPMILAEELDIDWRCVRIEHAPVTESFSTETGGSSSVREQWEPLRHAGAAARAVMIAAAATHWAVPSSECATEAGEVVHRPSARRACYGSLLAQAAVVHMPDWSTVKLKDPRAFRLVGQPIVRLDLKDKVCGRACFGLDVQLPGMLIASVLRCPSYAGRAARVEDARALAVPGVRGVVTLDPVPTMLPGRVAVLADTTWAALQGRRALRVTWDRGAAAGFETASMWRMARAIVDADERARLVARRGKPWELPAGTQLVEAVYEVPLAAHACMEPMNCTAHVTSAGAQIWAPSQFPQGARKEAAALLGVPQADVTVHVTLLGGGFGRRAYQDFVVEAVQLSRHAGTPVKVMWTREDDIQHDFYRPATMERFRAALDGQGRPIRWHNRSVGLSWKRWWNPTTDRPEEFDGGDSPPYNIPHFSIDYMELPGVVPLGAWRSVGHSQNGFCLESFIDECAAAARQDPLAYRLALLAGQPRPQAVLSAAARRAGWGERLPHGRGRGVAFWNYAGTYVAQVADVTVDGSGRVHVDRVVCAFDCGTVINPDTVCAQVEGAIVWGVNAALWSEIAVADGQTQQSNFHDYRILRMHECPRIEVELIRNLEAPTGVGEPAVPPVAAAVANAVYAATGVRRRRLPLNPDSLTAI